MHKLITIVLLLASAGYSQSIESGWNGILPLQATKAEVDAKLGKPTIDDNGYYLYLTKTARVEVNYSVSPCATDQYGRGKYTVPAETVLRYWVRFLNAFETPPVINFDKQSYIRDTSGDAGTIYYYKKSSPVIIGGEEMLGKEYITGLEFRPTESQDKKFLCEKAGSVRDGCRDRTFLKFPNKTAGR